MSLALIVMLPFAGAVLPALLLAVLWLLLQCCFTVGGLLQWARLGRVRRTRRRIAAGRQTAAAAARMIRHRPRAADFF